MLDGLILYRCHRLSYWNVLYWELLEVGMLHGQGSEFDSMNYISQAWGYMPVTQHSGGRGWKIRSSRPLLTTESSSQARLELLSLNNLSVSVTSEATRSTGSAPSCLVWFRMGLESHQKQSWVWNYAYPNGYTRIPTENSSANTGHFTLGFSNLFFTAFPFHFTVFVSKGGRSYMQRDFPLTKHLPEEVFH